MGPSFLGVFTWPLLGLSLQVGLRRGGLVALSIADVLAAVLQNFLPRELLFDIAVK